MSFLRKLKYLVPWVRRAEDRDIQDELAALQAIAGPRELGNLTLAAEDARGVLSWLWFERLVQDLRYAVRSMLHHKSFTALVVASLALGIGANTAIFSFMDSILLRPLPVRDPQSLVIMKWRAKSYTLATSGMMWSTDGSSFDEATNSTTSTIFPFAAVDVLNDSSVVSSVFSYFSASRLGLTALDQTESVKGLYVSGNYFDGIGVRPVAGRLIQVADDAVGSASVAVLSQRFSQRRFGGADAAIGQTVRINDKPFVVVGVAPSTFFGAEPGAIPDVFIPQRADSLLESPVSAARRYGDEHLYWLEIMARLKPGVTVAQARATLAPRFQQFAVRSATTEEQKQDLPQLTVEAGATGLDSLRRKYAEPIYILMAMVGLILVIACSNVANLLLSRASARRREIAVRLSIGAGRARVIRQLLTESVLLSAIGGALGIGVAWWGIRVLTDLLSNGRENFTLHAELNWTVLLVTFVLSVLTGLVFGLAPALQATRVDIAPALKDVRANDATRRRFGVSLSSSLVVAQVVFSLVLLVGAGLFGRTLAKLHSIQVGFDRENILLFTIRPSAVGYQGAALIELFERVRQDISRLPGAVNVTMSTSPLPMGGGTLAPVDIIGVKAVAPSADGRGPNAALASVGPDFFKTMGIPIVGRDFNDRDVAGAPRVAVVNRGLARLFGIENPVGQTLAMRAGRAASTTAVKDQFAIVGVVDDTVVFRLKDPPRSMVFFPSMQAERPSGGMVFETRTAGNPMDLAPAARETVRRIDSRIAVFDVKSQTAHIDQAISSEITLARLCSLFAALALVIACVGLYGTVAFNVARRTNEIGIRMTLGAARGRILWMVLRSVLVMAAVGLAIGIPLALFASRYVKTLLYGIEPNDPTAIAAGAGALLVCGLVAGFIPARRASRIDPMVAVRWE